MKDMTPIAYTATHPPGVDSIVIARHSHLTP